MTFREYSPSMLSTRWDYLRIPFLGKTLQTSKSLLLNIKWMVARVSNSISNEYRPTCSWSNSYGHLSAHHHNGNWKLSAFCTISSGWFKLLCLHCLPKRSAVLGIFLKNVRQFFEQISSTINLAFSADVKKTPTDLALVLFMSRTMILNIRRFVG